MQNGHWIHDTHKSMVFVKREKSGRLRAALPSQTHGAKDVVEGGTWNAALKSESVWVATVPKTLL